MYYTFYLWKKGGTCAAIAMLQRTGMGVSQTKLRTFLKALAAKDRYDLGQVMQTSPALVCFADNLAKNGAHRIQGHAHGGWLWQDAAQL